ncbi:MAG: ATP-binding protein [Pseudomonadota bacterium]
MSAPTPAPSTPLVTPVAGELLLRQIAANIEEMLWSWDPQSGSITYTNPAFETFWGLNAASLAGQPWKWLEKVAPSERDKVRQLQLGGLGIGTGQTMDYSVTRLSGETARLRQRVLPVHSPSGKLLRIIHLANNITWQMDTTSRLRAEITRRTDSEAKYQAVVENVNEGILITAAGRILYANPKALQLIGLDEATAKSKPFIEFIHLEDRERVLNNHLRRMRGEQVENYYHFRVVHHDIDTRWLEISAVLFKWQGEAATLNFLTDVTIKRQAEQDMRNALVQERELSELKSRFVAVASHEFRTPLAAILSSVELLDMYGDSFPPSERHELLGQIKTAVSRMSGMVEQVLMTSRLEAGGFAFKPAALSLADLMVQVVVEMERSDASAARISVQCNGLDMPRLADEKLLRHIFSNLLGNALKYSSPDTPVQLVARGKGELLEITVSDQGIGIPAGDLPRLFETFHRGTNVGHIAGTGIGLHIVKQCVDLHRGKIEVASEPGQGTRFTVHLTAPLAS